jgi:CHASE2 domain-containing sensor protein
MAFVGATALGIQDVVATPFDTAMPGIEAHAMAADTLLRGDFISPPPYWRVYELAAAFVFAMTAAALVAVVGFLYGSFSAAALLAVLWWATFRGVMVPASPRRSFRPSAFLALSVPRWKGAPRATPSGRGAREARARAPVRRAVAHPH